ncbi:MAG: DUF1513 domain-containing protein [Pseudomonadota bacterium]
MAADAFSRRRFLAALGSGATMALSTEASWADIGAPDLVAATRHGDSFRIIGLDQSGVVSFDHPLPARGHAGAVHPRRAQLVAFARRPGTFALVIDCASGGIRARLAAPAGRHFYGHGTFSLDGSRVYTTENAFDSGQGRIGIWDATDGYRRLGDMSSGGVGPHEIVRLPGSDVLAVANGGIRTHPAAGREKLNLPTMAPNVSYLDGASATLVDQVRPPAALRLNSMRHLAVAEGGLVAIAMQWQGDPTDGVPLLAFHRPGEADLTLAEADPPTLATMKGYAGSVAFDRAGDHAAITSPRGGRVMAWHVDGGGPAMWSRMDVCGLTRAADGWIATDGMGGVVALTTDLAPRPIARLPVAFDNHLISL